MRQPASPPLTDSRRKQIARDERPPEQRQERGRHLESEGLAIRERVHETKSARHPEKDQRSEDMTAGPGTRAARAMALLEWR